jgi:hypothetical protein
VHEVGKPSILGLGTFVVSLPVIKVMVIVYFAPYLTVAPKSTPIFSKHWKMPAIFMIALQQRLSPPIGLEDTTILQLKSNITTTPLGCQIVDQRT